MQGYTCRDQEGTEVIITAATRVGAAEEFATEYDPTDTTWWLSVYVDGETFKVEIDPIEPACTEEHDWQAPWGLVGGLKENPGVQGHGGGVVCVEVCLICGCSKTTDTWAQDPVDGEEGLTSTTYEEEAHDIEEYLESLEVDANDEGLYEGPSGWWGVPTAEGVEWVRTYKEAFDAVREWFRSFRAANA